jgi:hypothetical protein
VDLVGTARLLEAFLPLAQERSAIVCISSMTGHLTGTRSRRTSPLSIRCSTSRCTPSCSTGSRR